MMGGNIRLDDVIENYLENLYSEGDKEGLDDAVALFERLSGRANFLGDQIKEVE